MGQHIQSAHRKKSANQESFIPAKLSFKSEGKIKIFSDKQKLRQFVDSILTL